MSSEGAPKIIVDSDWKNQAQAEKERLAAEEASRQSTSRGPSGGHGGEGAELPPADFPSLVGMLVTQALMYLGGVADRRTGHAIFDPDMSRFYIDLLGALEEKTRGNLTEAEARDLQGALQELRGRYVELIQAVAKQGAQGSGPLAAGPGAGPVMRGA